METQEGIPGPSGPSVVETHEIKDTADKPIPQDTKLISDENTNNSTSNRQEHSSEDLDNIHLTIASEPPKKDIEHGRLNHNDLNNGSRTSPADINNNGGGGGGGGRRKGGASPLGVGVVFPKPENQTRSFNAAVCKKVNCGEGGCLVEDGVPKCICIDGWIPPDKYGRCIPIIGTPIYETNLTGGVAPKPYPARNVTHGLRIYNEWGLDNVHLQVIKIAVPVVGGIALILTIACFLLRRRRAIYNRPPISESPITWLQRQDSLILLDHLTVVSKNPNYYTPDLEAPSLANLKTKLIPRDNLKLLEEIGEGAFGKVFKGEVAWSKESVALVAVKVLKEGASRETREDFKREVEIMSAFDHENILKLIGVVAIEEDSPYMIFEYMEYGDLTDLLRKNDPIHGREKTLDLKQTDLIDIATQIANGMMYLTSQHFVHRDLATRNCLVGGELVVKISDFGMSRDIYTCDYYRIGGSRMLPVRWMSPESVKYGRFTSESDVWAYGVVLWEIFSYGKQPYYGHTNEEVIRFIEDGILLQKPDGCPSTIYHVMLGCWRSDPKDRFNFERIHRHLVEYGRKMVKCYHQLQSNEDAEFEDI